MTPGETTYVAFGNRDCSEVLAAANIIVRKFQDVNGDFDANDPNEGPLSGWHITITGTSGEALGKVYQLDTDGSGVAAFLGIETGTWTVSETAKVTHTVVGSVYTVGVGPADPTSTDSPAAGASRAGLSVALDQTLKVDFFNQPKGSITVVKTVTDNVGNVGVAGWHFNLDGCGVHKEGTTDGSGSIVWSNLLPCSNYIVTEVDANTDGFSVTPSATQSVNLGAGDEMAVTFHNQSATRAPRQGRRKRRRTRQPTPRRRRTRRRPPTRPRRILRPLTRRILRRRSRQSPVPRPLVPATRQRR